MTGNGLGQFSSPIAYGGVGYLAGLLVGDFNSDGVSDFGLPSQGFYSGLSAVTLYLSQPAVNAFPNHLNFGAVKRGSTSNPKTIHLTNTGNAALNISQVSTSGDFKETNACGPVLAVGGSCEIEVTFAPSGSGVRRGSVVLVSNATDGHQAIPLMGTGH
jgi:hypothetical protein